MREVSIADILTAREQRVQRQKELIATYRCPVICFTMNIAGPIKTSPLIERGFRDGIAQLDVCLSGTCVRHRHIVVSFTGCEAMYAVDADAATLKAMCVSIEENAPVGRLYDIDVLDSDGNKFSRSNTRGCIVCGADGRGCAARRLHDVATLQAATDRILTEHFAVIDEQRIADAAVDALIEEVNTTPKPGLVDRRNNGSHRDMTISTFHAAAKALHPYFGECFAVGRKTANLPVAEAFIALREVGVRAYATMMASTNGINTHKGAIYLLGTLCGGLGRLWRADCPIADTSRLFRECSALTKTSVDADFASEPPSTYGLQLYRLVGMRGVRGEVADGFPSLINCSLPAFSRALEQGLSRNDAGCITLLHLISRVEDTALYHRGGVEGARFAARAAQQLLQETPTVAQIEALDDAFIARNLSPGGCADLLAATYFIHTLQQDNKKADTYRTYS